MKKLITLIPFSFVLCTLYLFSCDTNEPPPKEEKPPGYQEDIPWPSLADSPWPMNHGNPQSTGRSKFPGPAAGSVLWSFDSVRVESGISIGLDSSILFVTTYSPNWGLLSLNPQGKLNWVYRIRETLMNLTTPLITTDGTIIASTCLDGKLIALNPDGSLKWSYDTGEMIQQTGINIGLDGTIYVVDVSRKLHAIDNSGNLLWDLIVEESEKLSINGNTFSPDGKTLYMKGSNVALLAVDIENQSIKWSFGNYRITAIPVVDSWGNIYILGIPEIIYKKAYLTSLSPNGDVKWRYFFGEYTNRWNYYSPTIDKSGNIYIAFDSLYSLNYLGDFRWKKAFPGLCQSPLTCDVNGIVYVPVTLSDVEMQILAFDSYGNQLWQSEILTGIPGESPALSDGIMYCPTGRSKNIYAIK